MAEALQNHTVDITIRASNLSTPEFQQVVSDLRGLGSAADVATADIQQVGNAAQTASGGLRAMEGSASGAVGSLRRIAETAAGVAIGNMMQDAPRILFEFGKASLTAASDFQESMNKVQVVFGSASDSIRDFASDAAENLGLSESAALDAAGTFGNLLTSMGMTQGAAAEMSTSIVQLAADLGSFNNIGTGEALEKIRSGLVGEVEPLRSLGVNISAAAVQSKALSMGLADNARSLTAADKAAASYQLILEQTTNAQGDFARTSDGLANSTKTLQGNFHDLEVQVGGVIVPLATDFVGALNDAFTAAETLTGILGDLSTALTGSGDAFDTAKQKAKEWSDEVRDAGLGLAKNAGEIAEWSIATFVFRQNADDASTAVHELIKATTGMSFIEFARGITQTATESAQLNDILQDTIDLLHEVDGSAAKAGGGSLLGKQGQSVKELGDAARIAKGELTEFANAGEMVSDAMMDAAVSSARLESAQSSLAGAYQEGLQIQSNYNDQASEYASQSGTIEKALEIQKKRLDEGAISQDEYNKYLERGTEAIGRYEGGIEDATLTAADYAIQNAELMKIQDSIQAQYPGLVQGSAEYNKKIEEAARAAGISQTAIDGMQGSNANLAGVIADVLVPALMDLARHLDELNGKTADVYVRTNFVAVGSPAAGGVGFTEFAEGGLVTKPTLALIGEAGPEVVVPLNQLPASAKADIMGNQRGQSNITMGQAGWLPFIESLVGDLDAASQAFSDEGLEHAKLFSDTASAGVSLMMDGLGLLVALSETPAQYSPDIEAGLKALVELSWKVAYHTGSAAEGLDTDWLEHSKVFSDAAQAGISTLSDGLELLQAFSETDAVWNPDIEARLKGLVELSWKVAYHMGSAAEGLVAQDGFLENATTFGTAVSASIEPLSQALELLQAIADDAGRAAIYEDDLGRKVDFLATTAAIVALSFGDAASRWDGEINPSIEQFADAVSNSIGAASEALELLQALADDSGRAGIYEDELADKVNFLGTTAAIVAIAFADAASRWDDEINPAIEAFATASSQSAKAATEALSLLQEISKDTDRAAIYEDELADRVEFLATTAAIVAMAFADAASRWDASVNPAIEAFSAAAGDALSAIGDANSVLDLLAKSADRPVMYEDQIAEIAGFLATAAEIVALAFADGAERWDASVNPAISAFSEAAGDSLGLIDGAVSAIDAIADFGNEKHRPNVDKLADELVTTALIITQAVETAAQTWQAMVERGEAIPVEDLATWADGAGKAVALMGDVASSYTAMATMSKITEKQVEIFQSNWETVLAMIPELVALSEPYIDDAERFAEIAELIAASFRDAASAIQTVAGDAATVASGVSQGMSKAVGIAQDIVQATATISAAETAVSDSYRGGGRGSGQGLGGGRNPGVDSLDRDGDGFVDGSRRTLTADERWMLLGGKPSSERTDTRTDYAQASDRRFEDSIKRAIKSGVKEALSGVMG